MTTDLVAIITIYASISPVELQRLRIGQNELCAELFS